MEKQSKGLNAGVDNLTGMNTQKNLAIYIIINEYSKIKDKKFSIYIEHHDDFLFCFKDDSDLVSLIDAYQSKKAGDKWGLSKKFIEIIKKLLEVGINIEEDKILKAIDYKHNLNFISNEKIHLVKKGKSKGDTNVSNIINEAKSRVKYNDLESGIKDHIKSQLIDNHKISKGMEAELKNISLIHVDFPKTVSRQKDLLAGMISNTFENMVKYPLAAINTLQLLFEGIECKYNQGINAELLDKSKSVDSNSIFEVFELITTKQKGYILWREKKDNIALKLKIPVIEHNNFKFEFESSFDLFKDSTQIEHKRIKDFVFNNKTILDICLSEIDCISDLYEKFTNEEQTSLTEIQLKATIYAAYFLIVENI